ncbi:MAG: AI-2E family transporter [Chloroflexi bacterium]|nr:AI-2E family transporter [Chloroflexota bacterium]
MSSDARNPAHPQRQAPSRPPTPATVELPAAPAASERRTGLTPVTLLLVLVVGYLLIQIQFVLVLVLLSLVFATVIQTPVDALERRHFPRPLAILLVYIGIIGAFTVLFVLLSPAIREQASAFREQAPQSLANLRDAWQTSGNAILAGPGQQLLSRGIAFIQSPATQAQGVNVPQGAALGLLTGLGGGIIGLLTVFVISFYYLMEKSWIRRIVLLDSPPETRIRVSRIWDAVEQKVGDWLRGQLTLCLVIGVTATIGYAVMGIQFWPLLGLWAGITEIIPILGPWLGGIPAVLIALTQGWEKGFLVIGFVVLLQLMENTILVPRIMRGAVGLTPLTVFIAILAGTEFAGIAGALLAIPIAAVIQVMVSHYTEARREAKLAGRSALPGWRWMRGSISPPAFTPMTPPDVGDDGGRGASLEAPNGAPGWSAEVLTRAAAKTQEPGSSESSRP